MERPAVWLLARRVWPPTCSREGGVLRSASHISLPHAPLGCSWNQTCLIPVSITSHAAWRHREETMVSTSTSVTNGPSTTKSECRPIVLKLTTGRKVYLMRKTVGRRFVKAEPHKGSNPGKKSSPLEDPCKAGRRHGQSEHLQHGKGIVESALGMQCFNIPAVGYHGK